jgi:hypothetical protein
MIYAILEVVTAAALKEHSKKNQSSGPAGCGKPMLLMNALQRQAAANGKMNPAVIAVSTLAASEAPVHFT